MSVKLRHSFVLLSMHFFLLKNLFSNFCWSGLSPDTRGWKQTLQVAFLITVCFVALAQCFTGSDILQWRSFYATQDDAWKAHYQEVFDHGIREVLCCLGRREYMYVCVDSGMWFLVFRLLETDCNASGV